MSEGNFSSIFPQESKPNGCHKESNYMRIAIIGAGHLGYIIAEFLSNEQYDVASSIRMNRSWMRSATRWTY